MGAFQIADHDVAEAEVRDPGPYDRLVLHDPKPERWIGTALLRARG